MQPKSHKLSFTNHLFFLTQATDPDSGDNGLLLYSLVNNQMNEFDIDENTGQIFTVSVAGKVETINLEVQAADQGIRQLTAQTTVTVSKIVIYSPDLLPC